MLKMPTLTRDSLVRSRATLEILLWRHGFLPGLTALAVLAAILVWAWFLPAQDRAYDQAVQGLAHQERAAGQQSVDAKGRPLPPLARFEDVLSDPADTNAIVSLIKLNLIL